MKTLISFFRSYFLRSFLGRALTFLVLYFSHSAVAHVGIHEEIESLSRLIQLDSSNPKLYASRGEAYCLHGDWGNAIIDFRKALDIRPDNIIATIGLGRTYMETGEHHMAAALLNRALSREPDNVSALVLLAQVYMNTGQPLMAVTNYTRAIDQIVQQGKPLPDYYLERARTLASAGDQYIDRALQGLDEGINILGNIRSLELYAVELESSRGNYDDALTRLDNILANAGRKELLLVQRGDILLAAGSTASAIESYLDAQAAIDALPSPRRYTATVLQTQADLDARLISLGVRNAID